MQWNTAILFRRRSPPIRPALRSDPFWPMRSIVTGDSRVTDPSEPIFKYAHAQENCPRPVLIIIIILV